MQNNNNPNGFKRFFRDNGYALIVGVCVLAVAVSSFFLLRDDTAPTSEETLSVPVTVARETEKSATKPQQPKQTDKTEETASIDEEAEDVIAEFPPDETAEATGNLQPSITVPTMRTVTAPVPGEPITNHSVSVLAYNVTTRDWRTHDGLDLAADLGMAVAAAEAGTVSAVYHDDYLGMTVEIAHDSGYTTIYSNLEETPPVSVGQTVVSGEVIGYVGSTALLEVGQPPHLHFAVTDADGSVDPADYLS